MVDIARPDIARTKRMRQMAYGVVTGVVVILITVGVSRFEPSAPGVDRDTVYTDSTVERIVLRPGVTVEPDTVIVELSNPQLEQSALEVQLQLKAARARGSRAGRCS